MQIRNGTDFWAGLIFIGFGLGFVLTASNYSMGSAARMGPGYFPTVLGGLLALLGGGIVVRAYISKLQRSLKVFAFRLPMLIAAIVVGGATYFASSSLKS
ncbi:MAG: tripartite tricarboxylate transporter TctB family protein, partial [Rhodanobacter sp.]